MHFDRVIAGGTVVTPGGTFVGDVGIVGERIVALGASLLNSESGQNLQDCLRDATTAADQEQCQREFQQDVENG